MNIAVNSRIAQLSKTGIPYYIAELYRAIEQSNEGDTDVTYLQTDDSVNFGKTLITNNKIYRSAPQLFDLVGSNSAIRNLSGKQKVFHGPAHILPLRKRVDTKYVVTVHDLAFMYYPEFYSKTFNHYYRLLLRNSFRIASRIIAVSESTHNDIAKFYPKYAPKVVTVPNGINEFYFQPSNSSRRIIEGKYFLSITTHPQRKNIFSVLEAFASSSMLRENYHYVIAGLLKGERGEKLKQEIARLGLEDKVILFGYASEEELRSLYRDAVFFIYPSFYEGFGFPVLEAMACGCPTITSSTSSMPELMPTKAWLVDPNSVNNIQQKMERICMLNPAVRRKLVQDNLVFAKQFRWSKAAAQTLSVFQDCL